MSGSAYPTYCPQCRTVRQPNGQFCHGCGYSYATGRPSEVMSSAIAPPTGGLSVGDGFRFGLGFFIAAVIFGLLFTIFSSVVFGALVGALLQALPR